MKPITKVVRTAYFAPSKGRHYFSLAGAVRAEALSMILKKHPTKHCAEDLGIEVSAGFYWASDIPRSDVLLRRVRRLVAQTYKNGSKATQTSEVKP